MEKEKEQKKAIFKKRLYVWVLNTIRLVDSLPKKQSLEVIGKQLIRSSTSVLANYVEAYAASSKKDHINFFNHSLKSANESKVWLALIQDLHISSKKEVSALLNEITEIANIFASSIITMRGKH